MVYIRPKQQKTKELEFLHSFKETSFFDDYIKNNKENYLFIEEPYTGFGYPDLMLVIWDKRIKDYWNENRNNLTNNDLKIIQHLHNCKKFKTKEEISTELGFSKNQVTKILKNILISDIAIQKGEKFKLKKKSEIFFIKEIITIEAKLRNWKSALFQASNSDYFSSEVFTLFPNNIVKENVIESYSDTEIGIIAYETDYEIVRPSAKKKIPITMNGWQFNEMIGRKIWQEC